MTETKTRKKRDFPKLDATQVIEGLRSMHNPDRWGFFEEVQNGLWMSHTHRFDVFALAFWETLHYERRVYEVKISRSDFSHELAQPTKCEPALRWSNTFYFAVPAGMVDKNEVPEECGLVYVNADGTCKTVKRAQWRDLPGQCTISSKEEPMKAGAFSRRADVPFGLFMSLTRLCAQAMSENRILRRIDYRKKRACFRNPLNDIKYHAEKLVEANESLAEPTCKHCSGVPENPFDPWHIPYDKRKEMNQDETQALRDYAEVVKKRRAEWWVIHYHRKELWKAVRKAMGLPEEEEVKE